MLAEDILFNNFLHLRIAYTFHIFLNIQVFI